MEGSKAGSIWASFDGPVLLSVIKFMSLYVCPFEDEADVPFIREVGAKDPCRAGSITPMTGRASISGVLSNASISSIASASSALQNRDIGEKSFAWCSFRRVHARKNGLL